MKLFEGLRIKNDENLQKIIIEATEYLKDKEEVLNDSAALEGTDSKSLRTFESDRRDNGYVVSMHILRDDNPDPHGNFNGVYVQGVFPPALFICADLKRLYKNDEVNEKYLSILVNTMEHELTHYLQAEDEVMTIIDQISHSYYQFDSDQFNKSYAAYCISYIIYQLFNIGEFESFLTSAANGDTLGIVNTLNETYMVSLCTLYKYAATGEVSLNFTKEMTAVAENGLNLFDDEHLFGEAGIEYAIEFLCKAMCEYYRKEYKEGEEAYWVRLFARNVTTKYNSFMKKYIKLVRRYHPDLAKEIEKL